MDVSLEVQRRLSHRGSPGVSILVLVDVSLEIAPILSPGTLLRTGVSILVLVDVSLKESVGYLLDRPDSVSILVLVDVSLEEDYEVTRMTKNIR